MKHLFRIPVLISILFALAISSCRENTLVNSKLSPSNNAIGIYDTFLSCSTYTYYDDTVITSTNYGGIPVFEGVGNYTDSFFGTMTAATYFNLIPFDYSTITDPIDSAVLILPYSGFSFGDTVTQTLTQSYQVFYMLDTLDYNTTYYSYNSKPIDLAHPLSDPTTVNVYHLKDSFGVNVLPQNAACMRIKLNLARLESHLLPAITVMTGSDDPTTAFLHAFNGICVQAADNRQFNTVIPYFQLDGTSIYYQAAILVYTHDTATPDTSNAPLTYYFGSQYCGHFNSISKSYSRFPVNNLITTHNDQVIALQNKPGANLDIVIPGIKSLPAGVINKAELQLTLLPGYYNYVPTPASPILYAPERLYPTGIGSSTYPLGIGNNVIYNIADRYPVFSTSPLNVIDGTLHAFTSGSTTLQKFTIDIPREVMASIAAKNDTIHLHLEGTEDYYGAFHMVAGGGNYPDSLYRARFFVVYSKLNN